MPGVVITRVRPVRSARSSRTFDERLMVRLPWLYPRVVAPFISALPPRSRVRRGLLLRGVLSGWASFDRRDFDVNFIGFAQDTAFEFPPELQALDVPGSFRGLERRREAIDRVMEVWGSDLEPLYILDLGSRLLNLGHWRIQGRASGLPLAQEIAQLVTLRRGLVVRDQTFFSWDDGLHAAGLDPAALALQR
jgi:hypothetical protein